MKKCTHSSIYNVLMLGGLMVGVCGGGAVSALTYQNSVDVEFTFNPTISISLSSPDLIIDNLTPGSSSDSNIITVDVSTNAGYGYYMSATAGTSTGNTDLTNQSSSSAKFTNLSSNVATLASFPDNNWGYSYSTDNGTTWISGSEGNTSTGYNGLPLDNDDSGATGIILTSTDSFTNSGSVKFKIGAKASTTQATGTYTNTVNFYAVANPEPQLGPESCEAGKICYHVNSLTQTEGTMGEQELDDSSNAITDNSTVTLLASNFSRTGYGFAGWSDTYDYTGNLYGPQETITTPTGTATNGLSLYAIWIRSAGSMQSDAASICSGLTAASSTTKTLNSVSALTDQRDGDTYAIAKLADGKCWMIENLRLDNTADHNSDGTLAQGYGTSATYGNFSGLANPEFADFSYSTTANSLYSSDGSNDTISIGTGGYPAYRMPRYNNLNTANRASSPTSNTFTADNTTGGMYSYGNYYTWHAAIADLAYNGTGYDSITGTSLCPTGWHLPTGGTAHASDDTSGVNVTGNPATFREFYNLGYKIMDEIKTAYEDALYNDSAYYSENTTNTAGKTASQSIKEFPNNFIHSGYIFSSSAMNRGSRGYYWSSTVGNYYVSDHLLLGDSGVYPGTYNAVKTEGLSIRCVTSS